MDSNEILEEIRCIREEHAKAFNYDLRAICDDWRQKQAQSGREFIKPTPKQRTNAAQSTESKRT